MTPFDYQALATLPTVLDMMHVLIAAEGDHTPTPQRLYAQIQLIVSRSRFPLSEQEVWTWPHEYLSVAIEKVVEGMNAAASGEQFISKHGVS